MTAIDIDLDYAGAQAAPEPVVRCDNLVHVYGVPGSEVAALRGIDLQVRAGEMVALLGPSGSGKSTLLWHLAGLLQPTAGTVHVCGRQLSTLNNRQLADLRKRDVGVVLQNAGRNLLPYVSALDNVRAVRRELTAEALTPHELLDAVGIGSLAHRAAARLSGGEKQRLAVAIALANLPTLLLADEPNSQLDAASSHDVIALLRDVNTRFGTTIVVVTHDTAVSETMDRTVSIRDGRIGAAGMGGEQFLVVGRDGSVQLPAELNDLLPSGSLLRAEPLDDGSAGVILRRVDGAAPNDAPDHGRHRRPGT
ncbi:ABC transporter ATP-binding protein [uncultured Jatrophihabitans sp.]|uniref:ABC transporter ATP-binding protein n=1 Tax=uncultured Jatrophihabitans sp. TaxID=1610747 RepID=UPI0035CB8D87